MDGRAHLPTGTITSLLQDIQTERPGAADELLDAVYTELKKIAQARLFTQAAGAGLQPTDLVAEAYLRLFEQSDQSWNCRRHFFWAASRAMRDILVENARRNLAKKRGGDRVHLQFDESLTVAATQSSDFLALDAALDEFQAEHERAAQIVMLRFFAGLTNEQVAAAMGLSAATVWRDWRFAKAWLLDRISRDK